MFIKKSKKKNTLKASYHVNLNGSNKENANKGRKKKLLKSAKIKKKEHPANNLSCCLIALETKH